MNVLKSMFNYLFGKNKKRRVPQAAYAQPLEALANDKDIKTIIGDERSNLSGGAMRFNLNQAPRLSTEDNNELLDNPIEGKRCEHCSPLYYYFDNRPNTYTE